MVPIYMYSIRIETNNSIEEMVKCTINFGSGCKRTVNGLEEIFRFVQQ